MDNYLNTAKKQFEYYKMLGEKTIFQIEERKLFWKYNGESNSIAIIIQHMVGNMLSRWTDFLTSDGEKPWRNRESEFEEGITNKEELLKRWNEGWDCLFGALNSITEEDWEKTIYIRNEPHSINDAVNRQLAHYPYHVGQIVFIGKMLMGPDWQSLSIPRGKSEAFNKQKFANPEGPPAKL